MSPSAAHPGDQPLAGGAAGPTRGEIGLVLLAFAASRLLYRAAGVRFNTETLAFYWQFLDPELLRSRLGESLLHLHSQPPLFNLFLGGVLKLQVAWQRPVFQGTFLALGLGLALSLLCLLGRLGAGRGWRLGLTLFFVVSPACVLYENHLFYPYPVTAALAASGLALHRFLSSGRPRDGVAFFSLLAAVCLTQSLFHLAWLVLVAMTLAAFAPSLRWRTVLAAAGPLLVVALWYGRGLALFGSFSASSWLGMSLAQTATRLTPPPERVQIARSDPALALLEIQPFSPLDAYTRGTGVRIHFPPPTGIPALDRPVKSTGAPNFNHWAYVGISRAYLAAARAWIARFPAVYLRSVGAAHRAFRARLGPRPLRPVAELRQPPGARGRGLVVGAAPTRGGRARPPAPGPGGALRRPRSGRADRPLLRDDDRLGGPGGQLGRAGREQPLPVPDRPFRPGARRLAREWTAGPGDL
jgi:hypothetical protein